MYEFNREDFQKVIQNKLFLMGLELMIEESFNPDVTTFRGDPTILNYLVNKRPEDYYSVLKEYSFPYLSPCEDPIIYKDRCIDKIEEFEKLEPQPTISTYNFDDENNELLAYISYRDVEGDYQLRNKIIEMAKDKYDPAWYCYIHMCQPLAIFVLYPMMKILYPNSPLYLYNGKFHTVLILGNIEDMEEIRGRNLSRDITKPVTVDLISYCIGDNIDWIYDGEFETERCIPEASIMSWYTKNFTYYGMDYKKFYDWYYSAMYDILL
ncbi:Hypothetical protein ORPV_787 [Orpheovirus IHUMI-LCC2]|uniref:Uncharacterized protein n=1 Tax=Orpheovirus IHUMI-LCC2 TaxID=2023057 RepID=A0A2I2L597_9VIRU|nr:Hypothetical protein ORPV_787 [Orpheovirus IHUMI-LCC2]SNW62691.1 Hypothetical protein ORPV_787 [Orpheovirus IHUMI-LCC2]